MNFPSSKYYYDIFLFEKLLTKEQIAELKELEKDSSNLFFKLRTFICSKEITDRYREYYNGINNVRGNVFLKDMEIEKSIFNTIIDEQKYHAKLLHISNFISSDGLEKLNQVIDRGILQRLDQVYSEISNYHSFQKLITTNKRKFEQAVEKGILKSIPNKEKVFDDFDMIPYYHHAQIFEIKNYLDENGEQNIIQFLKDIIAFLPENEIFGKISIDIKDDGRGIYYYTQRDLMITIEANGTPYSIRSEINSKSYDGTYNIDFNPKNGKWSFSRIVDIFNKIYREINSEYRLYIVSDLSKNLSHQIHDDSKIAVLVHKTFDDPIRQIPISFFLGLNSKNQIDPNHNLLDKDIDEYLDKMNEAGLFHLYSKEEIEQVRHLGKTKFLYVPVRTLWLFDYFVMAICPRESGSYKNFVDLVSKLTHGKVLLENFHENLEKGEFGFTLNDKSYIKRDLLKDRIDPFFILLINEAMDEQGLGAFYFWNNEFDPHEQFSVIYSNSDAITKANASSYFQFFELSKSTLQHWRD